MDKVEMRKLRAQLMLVGGLFAASVAGAALTATQRPFFESYMRETYAPLPADLVDMAGDLDRGRLDAARLEPLDARQLELLYENWMTVGRSEIAPKILVRALPIVYIDRVEKTLVCGSDEQRATALRFIRLAGSVEALPMLERFEAWATRRRLDALAAEVQATAAVLRRMNR